MWRVHMDSIEGYLWVDVEIISCRPSRLTFRVDFWYIFGHWGVSVEIDTQKKASNAPSGVWWYHVAMAFGVSADSLRFLHLFGQISN